MNTQTLEADVEMDKLLVWLLDVLLATSIRRPRSRQLLELVRANIGDSSEMFASAWLTLGGSGLM